MKLGGKVCGKLLFTPDFTGGIEMCGCMMIHNPASKNLSVDERGFAGNRIDIGVWSFLEHQAKKLKVVTNAE